MKRVFADTVYYLALLNPRDQYAKAAAKFTADFAGEFVTTAWILCELANSLAGGSNRTLFLELYHDMADDHRVMIVPPSQDLFEQGLDLYAQRPDKRWSLTDCISFVVMRECGITEALTADRHFEQAGFAILM